jgi:DNA polymerase III gamma/tau subunit
MDFASSVSFKGGRKYVILDEADYLNANSTQPALRNFMEEFSSNCGFILTANTKSRVLKALGSRTAVIDFKFPKSSLGTLALQFLKRTKAILDAEGIEYEVPVVAEVIKKYLPDWRRVLNELQRYSSSGRIDAGILANLQDATVTALIGFIKDKDYTNVRKWVAENIDGDAGPVFRLFYDIAADKVAKGSIPMLIMLLAKYQYQAAFAADPEINLAACLAEIMVECEFV